MRLLALSAALCLLAASPALAGGPRGGGHPPPRPGPCCGHGGSTNINVNVNAGARASAGASAQSYLNARTYETGSFRTGGGHGGSVYVGGGYGGDAGGYGYVGAPVYYDIDPRALACASAPFGYVVTGFGRDGRRPPACGYRREDHREDRGGRYGYSERHAAYGESRESYERFESYEAYEEYEEYEEYEAYQAYEDRAGGCDCRDRAPAPYPPAYLPEPPRAEPRAYPRPYEPRPAPPRQEYRQEPGERG